MTVEGGLAGKRILFLLIDGFDSSQFLPLRDCLSSRGALTQVASLNEGDTLTSADGAILELSEYSFAHAARETFDMAIVADDITAFAIRRNPSAMDVVEGTWEHGGVVVTVGAGALALIGAGLTDNVNVASSPELRDALVEAGARIAATPIACTDNIFSARSDADMQILCDEITFYLGSSRHERAA